MARMLICPPTLKLLAIVVSVAWMCTLTPCSAAVAPVPAMTTAAAATDKQPVPAAAAGVSTQTIPTAAEGTTPAATATASKKFPLAPPDVVEPAAEVVTALPVPVPETLPSAEGLGFGPNGFGTNGGLGGGGCCGGFGYNGGLGYNNGPLFFNSAPPRRSRMRDVLAPMLLTVVAAMLYV